MKDLDSERNVQGGENEEERKWRRGEKEWKIFVGKFQSFLALSKGQGQ